MGDVQRIERLNTKLQLLEMCITQTKNERNILQNELRISVGNRFFELFQEVAEIDQLIFNLKKEKQRIQNLI